VLEESRQKLKHLYQEYLEVQEKERHRIASDLHDGIGQTLSGIKISLENTLEGCAHMSGEDRERLEGILAKLQAGIEEVRRTAMNLRPATLDHFGIIATLDWFCREFALQATQLQVEKEIEVEEDQVPEEIKVSIFRVVQEGFNNVVRHAGAGTVSLSLYRTEQRLVLLVCDDGVGMDLKASGGRYEGLGLLSMRERVEYTHGQFTIDSTPGRGTRIKVEWPLPEGC
jgi:signal transduction histidine kinase